MRRQIRPLQAHKTVPRPILWKRRGVLYVGATRAKSKLYIGSQRPSHMQKLAGGRLWRGYTGDFSVEIGLAGDVLPILPAADPQTRAAALMTAAEALAARPFAQGGARRCFA